MKTNLLLLISIVLFLVSCKKDDKNLPEIPLVANGVYVLNEGLLSWGNASLSLLDLDSKLVYNNVFERMNDAPLGDVAQSIHIRNSLAYIVVNNSGRIYIIDKNTYLYHGEISGLTSPREICFVSDEKAYISDLFSKSITIFDPKDLNIAGSIKLNHTSESMITLNNKIYVLSWSFGKQLFVIDAEIDQVIDSVETGLQPNSMVVDKNEMLWVLSDGGFDGMPDGPQLPRLQCIDPISLNIVKDFTFPDYDWMTKKLSINQAGDSLFFISGGIYAMSIEDDVLPENPLIDNGNRTFYGLGIQPGTSTIYATDAINYVQPGLLYRFSPQGNLIDSFTVGIVPGDIEFQY
ncbi:MAG: YncE family protein [Bacteroidales bacterium]|nr:YncE family protein [Bacteroidales bacterium]MCF8456650.1 YncE family protein [Bacteroidales bacterium]